MSPRAGRTAQNVYAEMLRDVIGPRLRALGFKGSGGIYLLPDPDRWLVVGFQKNRYSTAESVSFTVNLTSAGKQAWAEARAIGSWLPARPSGNGAYPGANTIRLGPLVPAIRYDKWWEVGPRAASAVAAAEVVAAIEQVGIPWLRSDSAEPRALPHAERA